MIARIYIEFSRDGQGVLDGVGSLLPTAVGENAVMADAHEAVGQDMLQEAADEFAMLELHDFVLVVVAVVFVAEAYMLVIAVDETVVIHRDLVSVAGEVVDDGLGTLDVGLGVDHPVGLHELFQGIVEVFVIREAMQRLRLT